MSGAQAMTDPIDRLLEEDSVALHYRQKLKPVDEGDLSLFPPTYPANRETRKHRHGTPYTVNVPEEGIKTATLDPVRFKTVVLDSIQSQANRMEATFTREFAHTVPRIGVRAGAKTAMVTELSHRIADAAIRATDLEEEIRAAFEHHDAGDSVRIARLCPTALVYGAWDSRDTRVKIPRLIRCEIVAHDVEVSTRSAQFSGTFSREQLGMTETQWKKGAEVGFAPTPSVDQHGGVSVKGSIVQSAQIHLGAVRHLGDGNDGVLARYVLGLAVVGLLYGGREYNLRSGCWLVPDGAPQAWRVRRTGERDPVDLDLGEIARFLASAAKKAKQALSIPVNEEEKIRPYDPKRGSAALKKKSDDE